MRHRFVAVSAALVVLTLSSCQGEHPLEVQDQQPVAEPEGRSWGVEAFPGKGEIRTGWIYGPKGTPVQVTYEVYNGRAMFQGDIILGLADEIARSREELVVRPGDPDVAYGVIATDLARRWPGGIVPYENLQTISRVPDAMAMIVSVTEGISFVERTTETDYIRFVVGEGCSSHVGRVGGPQDIVLGFCETGVVVHEILHALGFWHEHSRCDRDERVEILWANIEEGKEHNFEKICEPEGGEDFEQYDETSIMHYRTHAFSKSSFHPTIRSLVGLDHLMGNRAHPVTTDIRTMLYMYGPLLVAVIAPHLQEWEEGDAIPFDASKSWYTGSGALTYAWTFGDGTCEAAAPPSYCSAPSPVHSYVDNLPGPSPQYLVVVTVTDGTISDTRTAQVTVKNAVPKVTITGPQGPVPSGTPFDITFSFTDGGVMDHPWVWQVSLDGNVLGEDQTNVQGEEITVQGTICGLVSNVPFSVQVKDKDNSSGTVFRSVSTVAQALAIVVRPGGDPTAIKLGTGGLLPVAVLSTPDFDARDVDPAEVLLGRPGGPGTPVAQQKKGMWHAKVEDVNGDGLPDLVLMFDLPQLVANDDLNETTTELVLRGTLEDACGAVQGSASIEVR